MANTDKFLDLQTGLPRLWDHVKDYVDEHGGSSVPISQNIATDTGSTDKVPSVKATETAINAAKTTLSTSVTSDSSSTTKASTPSSVYSYAQSKHLNKTLSILTGSWNTSTKSYSYTVSGVTTSSLAIVTSCSDDDVYLDSLSTNALIFKYSGSDKPSSATTVEFTIFK